MLLPQTTDGTAGPGASLHDALQPRQANPGGSKAAFVLSEVLVGVAALVAWTTPLQAAMIAIPNGSFESPAVPPVVPYAAPDMDYWQKSPQPGWYDPTNNFNTPWEDLMGTFYNVPFPSTFIDNCDGTQAAFLFAVPDAALFQDYDSMYGTNTMPSHTFNVRFNVNSAYSFAVAVIGGVDGSPPLFEGATLQLSLYYRDAASNVVTVAATTITNSAQLFPTNTHFIDFSVQLPAVRATDPWAGQHIGVQIASTVGFDKANGYWDVDNARLTEMVLPMLTNPRMTNSQFGFTVQSEPGLRFEILAATNPALPVSNWTSLGTVANVAGTAPFFDTATNLNHRYYHARQLP